MGLSFKCDDFLVSRSRHTPVKLDAHVHRHYEFLWFREGSASYIVNDKTYRLERGDVIITPPDTLHTISFDNDSIYSRVFIQISNNLLSQIPQQLIKNIYDSDKDGCIIHSTTAQKYKLYLYFDDVADLLCARTEKNIFLAKLIVMRFALAVNDAAKQALQSESSDEENPIISKIKAYVNENYTGKLNIDELAGVFHMSKYYLCHIFKEATGITIFDYIALRRIDAVKQHLSQTCGISDAFTYCGFNDYSSFYRTVKKYTGLKPSDFYHNAT